MASGVSSGKSKRQVGDVLLGRAAARMRCLFHCTTVLATVYSRVSRRSRWPCAVQRPRRAEAACALQEVADALLSRGQIVFVLCICGVRSIGRVWHGGNWISPRLSTASSRTVSHFPHSSSAPLRTLHGTPRPALAVWKDVPQPYFPGQLSLVGVAIAALQLLHSLARRLSYMYTLVVS